MIDAVIGIARRGGFGVRGFAGSSSADLDGLVAQLVPAFAPDLPRVDPWGTPYQFVSNGYLYRLISAGPDRTVAQTSLQLPMDARQKVVLGSSYDVVLDETGELVETGDRGRVGRDGSPAIRVLHLMHAAVQSGQYYVTAGWVGNGGHDPLRLVVSQKWVCADGTLLLNAETERDDNYLDFGTLNPGELRFLAVVTHVTATPRMEAHLDRPPRAISPAVCKPRSLLTFAKESDRSRPLPLIIVDEPRTFFDVPAKDSREDWNRAATTATHLAKVASAIIRARTERPNSFTGGVAHAFHRDNMVPMYLAEDDLVDAWGRVLRVVDAGEDQFYVISFGADGLLDRTSAMGSGRATESSSDESLRLLNLITDLHGGPYPVQPFTKPSQDVVFAVGPTRGVIQGPSAN